MVLGEHDNVRSEYQDRFISSTAPRRKPSAQADASGGYDGLMRDSVMQWQATHKRDGHAAIPNRQ